jgi:hypothetical protein
VHDLVDPARRCRIYGGGSMDYRDCVPRLHLLPSRPDQLLAELLDEVQTAPAIVAYYISCWRAYLSTENTPPSRYH